MSTEVIFHVGDECFEQVVDFVWVGESHSMIVHSGVKYSDNDRARGMKVAGKF